MHQIPHNLQAHVFRSPQFADVVAEAVEFLAGTPVHSLPPPEVFNGSGVYALYYHGDFPLYETIAEPNKETCKQPIYVGKAVPSGWRTARAATTETPGLFSRLVEHTRSIGQVSNLSPDHFGCRFMILVGVEADLIGSVEAKLIRQYRPLWNTALDGFGNHDPGSGRYNQAKSGWDVLHPGRLWAERLTGEAPPIDKVVADVRSALSRL